MHFHETNPQPVDLAAIRRQRDGTSPSPTARCSLRVLDASADPFMRLLQCTIGHSAPNDEGNSVKTSSKSDKALILSVVALMIGSAGMVIYNVYRLGAEYLAALGW